MMAWIRWILGKIILLVDWLTRPKPLQRTADDQAAVDQQTEQLKLYEFRACPFCVKTRRAIRRLGLNIETRDAKNDPQWRNELLAEGGKLQVPCLRVTDETGTVDWMYESSDIIDYLNKRFGS